MSGGSYNYLYIAAGSRDLAQRYDDLVEMRDRLNSIAPGSRAATDTAALVAAIDDLGARSAPLADVWREIEWWDSCDGSEDQARAAVAAYEPLRPERSQPRDPYDMCGARQPLAKPYVSICTEPPGHCGPHVW